MTCAPAIAPLRQQNSCCHRLFCLGLVWVLLLQVMAGLPAGIKSPSEYEVKAAMLVNFAKFVEWSDEIFETPESPLVIGILGSDPFGATIDQMADSQTQGKRPIIIRRLSDTRNADNCQVIFVASSARSEVQKLLGDLQAKQVLTVSEGDDFTRLGGHVRFYLQDNRIRFEVNVAALERSRIKMHSQVLKLAKVTRDGKETSP